MRRDLIVVLGASLAAGCISDSRSLEVCDGVDNNGDGRIDEGFDVGAACSEGGREGELVCATPFGVRCDVRADAGTDADADAGPARDASVGTDAPKEVGAEAAGEPAAEAAAACRAIESIPFLDARVIRSRVVESDATNDAGSPVRCESTVCDRLPDGSVLMSYCFDGCKGIKAAFALCEIAETDARQFDAHWSSGSVLELLFCVEGQPITGELNLWYGFNPFRRILRILRSGLHLPEGCYARYFAPEQAETPRFDEIPAACRALCGGEMGDGGESCQFDYAPPDAGRLAPMALASENCAEPSRGRIRILSLKRLPSAACSCDGNADCSGTARDTCRPIADTPQCPARVRGLCGPSNIGPLVSE